MAKILMWDSLIAEKETLRAIPPRCLDEIEKPQNYAQLWDALLRPHSIWGCALWSFLVSCRNNSVLQLFITAKDAFGAAKVDDPTHVKIARGILCNPHCTEKTIDMVVKHTIKFSSLVWNSMSRVSNIGKSTYCFMIENSKTIIVTLELIRHRCFDSIGDDQKHKAVIKAISQGSAEYAMSESAIIANIGIDKLPVQTILYLTEHSNSGYVLEILYECAFKSYTVAPEVVKALIKSISKERDSMYRMLIKHPSLSDADKFMLEMER